MPLRGELDWPTRGSCQHNLYTSEIQATGKDMLWRLHLQARDDQVTDLFDIVVGDQAHRLFLILAGRPFLCLPPIILRALLKDVDYLSFM